MAPPFHYVPLVVIPKEAYVGKASLVNEEELKPPKHGQRNRQWFRNIFPSKVLRDRSV